MSYLDRNEILILRVLLNIRLCINGPSTKNLCKNKCDMVLHQISRLISVFLHRTHILLVLACGFSSGSLLFSIITYFSHTTNLSLHGQQIASFEILLLFKLWQLCKYCKGHAYIMPKIPINE